MYYKQVVTANEPCEKLTCFSRMLAHLNTYIQISARLQASCFYAYFLC
jgi:hypothetical protein